MDADTCSLMDRVVGELTSKEPAELSTKLRRDAAHSYQIRVPGSGVAMNKALAVVHQHYRDVAVAVFQSMLRVAEDASPAVAPEWAKELKERYDRYMAEPRGRILHHVVGYIKAIGSEPIPAFSNVEKDIREHHHNEIELWVRKAIADQHKGSNVNVTYNLTESNPRVNINSQDFSINVQNAPAIFQTLRDAIERGVEDTALREQLVKKATEMEAAVGDKPKFLTKYNEFITAADKTISVFGKLLPAISQYLLQ